MKRGNIQSRSIQTKIQAVNVQTIQGLLTCVMIANITRCTPFQNGVEWNRPDLSPPQERKRGYLRAATWGRKGWPAAAAARAATRCSSVRGTTCRLWEPNRGAPCTGTQQPQNQSLNVLRDLSLCPAVHSCHQTTLLTHFLEHPFCFFLILHLSLSAQLLLITPFHSAIVQVQA